MEMRYQETDLVRIARRENNKKRSYLVVNPLQGKHVPVSPKKALRMMDSLAELVGGAYPGERLLLVGFAETATGIGARLAVKLGAGYLQTTREQIAGVDYLYFTESHSHAAEQKLVKDDLDRHLSRFQRVVFVEDEVTTGNTILKIVELMEKEYPQTVQYSVASLLNGMDPASLLRYQQHGITLHYLVKTDHSSYTALAGRYQGNGKYISMTTDFLLSESKNAAAGFQEIILDGCQDARRYVEGERYDAACELLWRQIKAYGIPEEGERCLVLGTEEFMYPALYAASKLEEAGCQVRYHATTRSPIEVSCEEEYPLHTRYELQSLYEEGRRTFVYNLEACDRALIISDAPGTCSVGIKSLVSALQSAGNQNIICYRWCKNEKLL